MNRTMDEKNALVDKAIVMISDGESLRSASRALGIPVGTLHLCMEETGKFEQYTRARERGAIARAEEMEEMAEAVKGAPAEVVAAVRLQIETRKWLLSKMAKKLFGQSPDVEVRDDTGTRIIIQMPPKE